MKSFYKLIISLFFALSSICSLLSMNLSQIPYAGAGIMPLMYDTRQKEWYVLMGRENSGPSKGKWDIWGGAVDNRKDKDSKTGSLRASYTAAREFTEETLATGMSLNQAKRFISVNNKNTLCVVANKRMKCVTYITNFGPAILSKIEQNFYKNPHKMHLEKDLIGWMRYKDLLKIIKTAKKDRRTGKLNPTIKPEVLVVNHQGKRYKRNVELRPYLLSSFRGFAQGRKANIKSNNPRKIFIYN